MSSLDTLVSREQGGPEDDWRERCIWEDGQTETQTAFYWADSMADLESFWPEVVPHAFWLDGQYTSSPMGMSYAMTRTWLPGRSGAVISAESIRGRMGRPLNLALPITHGIPGRTGTRWT